MRATINGETYDTRRDEEICNNPSPDGDDQLYRTSGGRFYITQMSSFVDGVRLRYDQAPGDIDSGLDLCNLKEPLRLIERRMKTRLTCTREIIPMSDREALVWCVKTQIPDCFRSCVLDSI